MLYKYTNWIRHFVTKFGRFKNLYYWVCVGLVKWVLTTLEKVPYTKTGLYDKKIVELKNYTALFRLNLFIHIFIYLIRPAEYITI